MNAETLAPLTVETPWGDARLTALRCLLPDGRVGWYMRRIDDCLKAATATTVQVSYDELPAIPNLGALIEWADRRGFDIDVHREAPTHASQWIGVTPPVEDGAVPGYRHTVVMSHSHLYHDPAMGFVFANGSRPTPTTELENGITIEKRSNDSRTF